MSFYLFHAVSRRVIEYHPIAKISVGKNVGFWLTVLDDTIKNLQKMPSTGLFQQSASEPQQLFSKEFMDACQAG